jgi:hypothetical protein
LTFREFLRRAYAVKVRVAAKCDPDTVGRFTSTPRCAPGGGD